VRRFLPCILALSSCGYAVGGLYEVRDVHVDILDNVSERRTHEFDLTSAIVHELTARGIRVNAKGAAYTLKGRITDIVTPSVVDQKNTDQVLVGSLVFRVQISLVSSEGAELWKDERVESVTFTGSRGESFETARQKVFDRLARWVVTHFEKDW